MAQRNVDTKAVLLSSVFILTQQWIGFVTRVMLKSWLNSSLVAALN